MTFRVAILSALFALWLGFNTASAEGEPTMTFPPEVERWRATVAKYFPAHLVDKALWTIQHESGGNSGAVGDGGVARGLFQIQDNRAFSNRPTAQELDDPEFNIRYAADSLGAASGNFGAWGEGTTHNGKPFGAFGNNQYPGSNASVSGSSVSTPPPVTSVGTDRNEGTEELERIMDEWVLGGANPDEYPYEVAAELDRRQNSFNGKTQYEQEQDAFQNWAKIEGLNEEKAASAWRRFTDKQEMARTAADSELRDADTRNAELNDMQDALENSSTPGLRPMPLVAGYLKPSFEASMAKWRSKFGADGPEPPTGGYVSQPTPASKIDNALGNKPAAFDPNKPYEPGNPWNGTGPNNVAPDDLYGVRRKSQEFDPFKNDPMMPPASSGGYNNFGRGFSKAADLASRVTPGMPAITAGIQATKAAKKGGRWFRKRFLAGGGRNLAGGPAWVGEKEPELLRDSISTRIVGANGPEEVNVPDGADVIPVSEAFQMHQIRQAKGMPPRNSPRNPADPNEVMQVLKAAIAAQYAAKPPATPMPYGGATDLYEMWRPLTGAMPQPQPAGGA